jgi:hypothetical protein
MNMMALSGARCASQLGLGAGVKTQPKTKIGLIFARGTKAIKVTM